MTDEIAAAKRAWRDRRFESKEPAPKKNSSGIPIRDLFLPEDAVSEQDYCGSLGFPGEYPFTRGVHPTMYSGRLWTMRQYAGFGAARETNARYKYLLEQGQKGLSVAFDLPTQIGYDSDNPAAVGEVGKVGVAVDTLADMEILFDGIPLDKVSASMTINSTAAIILAMYRATGLNRGVAGEKLRGTIQNDILKEYIARGTYIFPPGPSLRLITDVFEYCRREMPLFNTISISGYHIREAGATAAQEIAFTLADGIEYVRSAIGVGLDVDSFAGRLSFFFNAHNNFFEEAAKFRAARRLWARIMKERFKAKEADSCRLRFHTQTAGSMLTSQQPENNIARVALQAMAAVLGGTQSLHTNSRDEALGLPTEESALIALRTQQIIACESEVTDTIDPLAGSYYVESLTDALEEKAREYIGRIDDLGGMARAIEAGYPQREIQDAAYRYQREVESKKRIVVGVNEFVMEEKEPFDVLKIKPDVERKQIEALRAVKSVRDDRTVSEILNRLAQKANTDENLMPIIVEAVMSYASVGEISDVFREVFGAYSEAKLF